MHHFISHAKAIDTQANGQEQVDLKRALDQGVISQGESMTSGGVTSRGAARIGRRWLWA